MGCHKCIFSLWESPQFDVFALQSQTEVLYSVQFRTINNKSSVPDSIDGARSSAWPALHFF